MLPTDAVGQNAHWIAGNEIGNHHHGDEGRGFADVRQLQIVLNRQVKRHQRHLIDVREGMKNRRQDQRSRSLTGGGGHGMSFLWLKKSSRNTREVLTRSGVPSKSNPCLRWIAISSVWIARTDRTLARSMMRSSPGSPTVTCRFVSGEITSARAHGGNANGGWKVRGDSVPSCRNLEAYAWELSSLMPYSQTM